MFCRTGGEMFAAETMMQQDPEIQTVVPVKKRIRRTKSGIQEEKVVLFPGYVFFCADEDFLTRVKDREFIYRILRTEANDWRLQGRDRELVSKFFEHDGVIELSKAYYEGNRIRITEGFMKNFEGQIIRVNHRNKTAQIQLDFVGRQATIWLGFELVEPVEDSENKPAEN